MDLPAPAGPVIRTAYRIVVVVVVVEDRGERSDSDSDSDSDASLLKNAMTTIGQLADPPIRYVNAAALDYLVIEAIQALKASSAVATARRKGAEKDLLDAGLVPPEPHAPAVPKKDVQRESMASLASRVTISSVANVKVESDLDEEDVLARLDAIGVHVGSNIAERCVLTGCSRITLGVKDVHGQIVS